MASKVYWADLRTDYRENLPQKLTRLMKTAGMGQIDFEGKFTAIKLHFGEPGNLAFLRPNWAKTVADFVKERGGKPFLTDCNTLYVGGRKNALDHMDAAMLNGFSPLSTGCQIIIADGLKGNDDAGGEEDAEQPLTAQVIHEQPGDLVRQERAAPDISLVAQRTVTAIARTRIRKQRFHHDAVPARRQRNRIEPASVQLAPAPLFIA